MVDDVYIARFNEKYAFLIELFLVICYYASKPENCKRSD
jgi:hypothetical protein